MLEPFEYREVSVMVEVRFCGARYSQVDAEHEAARVLELAANAAGGVINVERVTSRVGRWQVWPRHGAPCGPDPAV